MHSLLETLYFIYSTLNNVDLTTWIFSQQVFGLLFVLYETH